MKYPTDPNVLLYQGKFTDGDPGLAIQSSRWPANHANAITDEIMAVITAAGLTPDEGDLTQLAQAIQLFSESRAVSVDHVNGGRIVNPGGAFYVSSGSSKTGAIKITLPTHGTADMIGFEVSIFDYAARESIKVLINGYLYQAEGGDTWRDCEAVILSTNPDKDYPVRFGTDGANSCVWIGNTTQVWGSPQVFVTTFYGGFSTTITDYADGWNINIVQALDTVDETLTGNFPQGKNPGVLEITGNATATENRIHYFTNYADLTLPDSAPDNSWVIAAVDYSVDLSGGDCNVLPETGQINSDEGLVDDAKFTANGVEYRFIKISGVWTV